MLFERIGRLVYRRRKAVLALTAAFVAFAAVWGTAVFGVLDGGGFDDPTSESSRAVVALEDDLGRAATDVVVVYRAPDGSDLTVDSPAFASAVQGALAGPPAADVVSVTSFWSTDGAPAFVSTDRHATYVAIQLAGATEDARQAAYDRIADSLAAPGLTTLRGGQVPVFVDVNTQVSADIAKAESLSIPLLVILLILVFGSLAAASLPAGDRDGGHPRCVHRAADAVPLRRRLDLLGQHRHDARPRSGDRLRAVRGLPVPRGAAPRLDRRGGGGPHGRDRRSDGGLLRASPSPWRSRRLLLFPQNFLRSMGAGGISAVLVAMVAALTLLPALLGVLGPKVDALRVPLPWNRRRLARAIDPDAGPWARLARGVMRRPMPVAVAVVTILLVLGAPFLRVAFGGVDSRVLPSGTESQGRRRGPAAGLPGLGCSQPDGRRGPARHRPPSVDGVRLRAPGRAGCDVRVVVREVGGSAHVVVSYAGQPQDDAARELVAAVLAFPCRPAPRSSSVAPQRSRWTCCTASGTGCPGSACSSSVSTFVLLFLAFGSVVLPGQGDRHERAVAVGDRSASSSGASRTATWPTRWASRRPVSSRPPSRS